MSRIFLSYAHEDIGTAKKIYNDLIKYDLDIWFDTESLLPGQKWEIEIEKAIENSKYFLVLLSSHSMTKRGFVQKELKYALEVLERCSEEDIFIIPIRLDDCSPSHRKINQLHWIDIFPDNEYQQGIEKILKVVRPDCFVLRSHPKELSRTEVINMLRMHNFYDIYKNPGSDGFPNQYLGQEILRDQIIIDKTTNLMWQAGGSSKDMYHRDVKIWIDNLNAKGFAGFHDWRLPTLEESMSLMECVQKNGDLFIDTAFNKRQKYIWTSDTVKKQSQIWVVGFVYGGCFEGFYDYKDHIKAVRSII